MIIVSLQRHGQLAVEFYCSAPLDWRVWRWHTVLGGKGWADTEIRSIPTLFISSTLSSKMDPPRGTMWEFVFALPENAPQLRKTPLRH